jgi:CheY-like chemotaxis protein
MMMEAREILDARILIVDDQPANVQLLTQLLREAGYSNVDAATQSTEVCDLHRRNRYDAILLDLQMPGMDGFQVMEELKADAGGGYLPVLVLTAQPGHKLRALQGGARDFISKPFDLVEVKTRIHNMLEVRLLYKRLEDHNRLLEKAVLDRTAELRESEARFRRLTELSTDWYWEQDESGKIMRVSGPAMEMLGICLDTPLAPAGSAPAPGWNDAERAGLQAIIAARQPFLDYAISRPLADGSRQRFHVSGEPIFNQACRYIGYRGVGIEIQDAN